MRNVHAKGMDLLSNPLLNKDTAFSEAEREAFGLEGLLPPNVESLDDQCARAYEAFSVKPNDLERYIYLRQLQDTNEVLFYHLLGEHLEELMPIVYTPVVGVGCQRYSHIYRRPRGLIISYSMRQSIPALLRNSPNAGADVIVVTDGERVLGIGDQGVGGLGIPIGKLSLYTMLGGIHPHRTLPILLDVGTNNEDLLRDPRYLGWRHHRVTGPDYDAFIDRFVDAVKEVHPGVLLQWEDFSNLHARPILDRYRDKLLTLNDDIQGTAAIVLAGLLAAVHVVGSPLRDQEIVIFGAGSASTGVADYMRQAMTAEGMPEEEALRRFWIVNRGGLLHSDRTDLNPIQRLFAQPASRVADWPRGKDGKIGLSEVIHQVRSTILIGLSTQSGSFTEAMVREMARKVDRPIIFPLSNPTALTEALPSDLLAWTDGRALIATGSPFPPVHHADHIFTIPQCNNAFIFPAIGLACAAMRPSPNQVGARMISDDMIIAGARALAEHSPALKDLSAPLLPALTDIRGVAVEVAYAIAAEAERSGIVPRLESSSAALHSRILARRWSPAYELYAPDPA